MSDTILLGGKSKKKKWASVGSQLKKLETLPTPIRLLASPKTTAILGTTLAALTGGAALIPAKLWTGTKILGGVALAEGLIQESPKVEEFAKRKLQPEKVGKYLGEKLEGFGQEDKGSENSLTFKEKVKEGLKKAGIIGAAVVGAGALAVGAKKALPFVKEKLEDRKQAKILKEQEDKMRMAGLKQVGFTDPRPVTLGGVPVALDKYPQTTPSQARREEKMASPIQNIIQIQVQ